MEKLTAQIDERQIKLIGGCIAILVVAATVTYGYLPKAKELRSLFESRGVLSTMNANQQDAQGEISRLQAEIEALTQQLSGDMANLPMREMEAFIIGRLQEICWRNDVTLIGVEPGEGESVQMYREVLFNVELSGAYFGIAEWLRDVSSELGFVVIKQFQFAVSEPDPQNPTLTTTLKLAAYRVLEDG